MGPSPSKIVGCEMSRTVPSQLLITAPLLGNDYLVRRPMILIDDGY